MHTCEMECYGGPMDGKNMPVPQTLESEACLIHIDPDGRPYFYVTRQSDGRQFLDFAGSDPYDVVDKLREIGSPNADFIEAQLNEIYAGQDEEGEENED